MGDGILTDVFKRLLTESSILVLVLGLAIYWLSMELRSERKAHIDTLEKLADVHRMQAGQVSAVTEAVTAMTEETRDLKDLLLRSKGQWAS